MWEQTGTPRAIRAEGRGEDASERLCLLPGITGKTTRLALALLTRLDLLWRFNGTLRARWLGKPVAIPLVMGNGVQHVQASERWLTEVIQRLLTRTSGAFVDVGANIGQTLLKVKMADAGREYYGFEPNPTAASYLQLLITRNGFRAATVLPIGLSDHAGIVTLFLKDDVDPSASLVTGFRQPERYSMSRGVSVHRGDDVFRACPDLRLGVLKIDVEGAEVDVLVGCEQTIARDRPFIICEVLPVYDPATDVGRLRLERQRRLRELLTSLGYDIYRSDAAGRFERIVDFAVDSDISRANYLFVPAGSAAL